MGTVSAGEDCSVFLLVTVNKYVGNTCDICRTGFGKMRPLEVIKYKNSVITCKVFLYFVSVFFIFMFFKYCLLVIRVYIMLSCYLKSQDTLAMTVPMPRVRGQGLSVPVGGGGTSNSTGRLKGRKNFQEE